MGKPRIRHIGMLHTALGELAVHHKIRTGELFLYKGSELLYCGYPEEIEMDLICDGVRNVSAALLHQMMDRPHSC